MFVRHTEFLCVSVLNLTDNAPLSCDQLEDMSHLENSLFYSIHSGSSGSTSPLAVKKFFTFSRVNGQLVFLSGEICVMLSSQLEY